MTPEQQAAIQNARARRQTATLEEQRKAAIEAAKLRRSEANKPMETTMGRTALDQGMQGATFGFADEITDRIGAGIASLATGESYDSLLQEARAASQERLAAEMEQRPVASILSNVAGGLLTGGAGASTKAGTTVANSLRTGNTAARVGKAALAGAASGAAYGAGSAQEGERLQGAVGGAAVGAALPVAFAGTRAAIGAGAKATKKTAEIVRPSPSLEAAEKKVLQRLADDNLTLSGLESRLKNAPGAAIIDAGKENLGRLGEAVANIPGDAANTAARFVEQRASGATKRIKADISKYISSGGELSVVADELMKKGEEIAAPLYKAAYDANKDISSPVINRLLKTNAGKDALSYAANRMNTKMSLMGVPDAELAEQAKLAGQYVAGDVGISKGLKLQTLQFVKEGYDNAIGAAMRKGEKGLAGDLIEQKNGLVRELDKLDQSGGLYAKARKAWSGAMQGQESLEMGRNFLKLDTPEIKKLYSGLGDTDKELFKVGVAQHMRDLVSATPDRSNIAKKIFGKDEYRQKLQSVLGREEYNKFRLSMMREDRMYLLNQKIMGNSRTLLRQQEVSDLMQDPSEILIKAATGNKTMMLVNQVATEIVNRYQGINRKTAGEIANILFERDPSKQQEIILRLQQRAAAGNKQAAQGYIMLKNSASAAKNINPTLLPGVLAGQVVSGGD